MMKIAIIGAGVAGISMMSSISRYIDKNKLGFVPDSIHVDIYEHKEIGGTPYQTQSNACLLNIPASLMSIDHEKPNDFVDWLAENGGLFNSIPRYKFGEYLKERYKTIISSKNDGVYFRGIKEEVINIKKHVLGFYLYTNYQVNHYDKVVVCAGHSEPQNLLSDEVPESYINNPWDYDFNSVSSSASVAIIGTRLTALDVAKQLIYNGHKGDITLYSRSASLPHVRSLVANPTPLKYLRWDVLDSLINSDGNIPLEKVIELFSLELESKGHSRNLFSKESKSALSFFSDQLDKAKGSRPDQDVMMSVYHTMIVDFIWRHLSLNDKEIFNAKYASRWMSMAHPIPFENGVFLKDSLESGHLKIRTNLQDIRWLPDSKFELICDEVFHARLLINCTGMSKSITKHKSPLFSENNSLSRHYGHQFGGLNIDYNSFQLISTSGHKTDGLYANGAIASGVFFSAFATPHVVRKADMLTRHMFQETSVQDHLTHSEIGVGQKVST